jgi:uncharacterized LabA/DUF88 family protein
MARKSKPMSETPTDSVPVPDPTVLTTDAIRREITTVKDLLDQRIEDRDREVMGLVAERNSQLMALRELVLAKIEAEVTLTAERFATSERLRLEQKADTKAAVDAALTAQKEAVKEQTIASERAIAKSEAATTKQLEQQQVTFQTVSDALRRSIDEVKERAVEENRAMRNSINGVGVQASGVIERRTGATESRTAIYATVGLLITIILAMMALAAFLATQKTIVEVPKAALRLMGWA